MPATFEDLSKAYGEVADLGTAIAMMSWDQQTYMPAKASAIRGTQIATLSTLRHERLLASHFDTLLSEVKASNPDQEAFIRELRRDRDRARKLPAELVHALAVNASEGFEAWVKAKQESNFTIFAPSLRKGIELARRVADLYGYQEHPWDALAEEFERGTTASLLKRVLGGVASETRSLLARIAKSPVHRDFGFLRQKWSSDGQWEFGMRVLRDIGFDLDAGRQDRSAHPFTTTFGVTDVRLTTRLREDDLLGALGSTIHEAGHGLFEQGYLFSDARTPLATSPSFGIHESQSRLWEVRIGQSKPFWKHYLPILKSYFPGQLDGVDVDLFYAAVNRVEPSLIRVEADEVTYNLHIIVRFELELALLSGELDPGDVPDAWNAKMKELLGVTPPNDALGCLQDVHWSHGSFGYFPSYSLGNIYAAMLMEKIEGDLPGLWNDVEHGQFRHLLEWLRENIHRKGARLGPVDLVRQVTGKEPSSDALIRYFGRKYGELYAI